MDENKNTNFGITQKKMILKTGALQKSQSITIPKSSLSRLLEASFKKGGITKAPKNTKFGK